MSAAVLHSYKYFAGAVALVIAIFVVTGAHAQTPGTLLWCTTVAAGVQDCGFQSPIQACQDQKAHYAPNAIGLAVAPTNAWYIMECKWKTGPNIIDPGSIFFQCNMATKRVPYGCVPVAQDYPSDCNCNPNNGGSKNPATPHPINILSGAKFFQATDFETADGLLHLKRFYNSKPFGAAQAAAVAPPLGLANWRFDFQYELQIGPNWPASHYLALLTPDGTEITFTRQSDGTLLAKTSNSTLPHTDYTLALDGTWPATLSTLPNSQTNWILQDKNGTIWNLQTVAEPTTGSFTTARPVKMTTRNGYVWNFTYGATGTPVNALSSITDSYGKTLTFNWIIADGSMVTGWTSPPPPYPLAIASVTLPSGDMIKYTYDTLNNTTYDLPAPDRLSLAQYVDAAMNVQDSTSYQYSNATFPYAITSILDKNNVTRWSVTYDSVGHASTSTGPNSAENYAVSYTNDSDTSFSRTVTNPLGKQVTYNYTNTITRYTTKFRGTTGIASANTPASSTSVSYSSSNFISSETDENGNITNYT